MSSTTAVVLVVGILAGALATVVLVVGVAAIRGWVEVKRLHVRQQTLRGEEPTVSAFDPAPSHINIRHQ